MVESCHARRDARPTYLVTIGHPSEYQSDPFLFVFVERTVSGLNVQYLSMSE